MDITNSEVVSDALREINVIGQNQNASAEQAQHALRQLNGMIEAWSEDDCKLPGYYEQTDPTDTCPIPDWSVIGVKAALAVVLAPHYGATVGPALAAKADQAYRTILRKTLSEKMKPADMSHMPQGSARYGYDIDTDSFS